MLLPVPSGWWEHRDATSLSFPASWRVLLVVPRAADPLPQAACLCQAPGTRGLSPGSPALPPPWDTDVSASDLAPDHIHFPPSGLSSGPVEDTGSPETVPLLYRGAPDPWRLQGGGNPNLSQGPGRAGCSGETGKSNGRAGTQTGTRGGGRLDVRAGHGAAALPGALI